MANLAIIGGSGLDRLAILKDAREQRPATRYGQASGPIVHGRLSDKEVYFLARHGSGHTIPPHRINYRANIAALAELGVSDVLAVTAVGGIASTVPPRKIVIPHQIIDYTHGREHTFSDGLDFTVQHVDFTDPFCERLRQELIDAAAAIDLAIEPRGTYGATQGPRLESAAEIARLARDGCTIVGMTGMPEAGLAREAGLNYVNCSLVVNWAAGIGGGVIELDEIDRNLSDGMVDVLTLVTGWLQRRGL
jgi:5'-methylthioinosine phosphorylase